MKKLMVMMGLLLWCAGCQSMDSSGAKCQRLRGVWDGTLGITKPGHYCLTGRVGSSEENALTYLMQIGRPTVGANILASDVSIDLGGNVVGSSRVIALILGVGGSNYTNPVDVGNITIRNGYITSGNYGVLSFSPLQAALRKQVMEYQLPPHSTETGEFSRWSARLAVSGRSPLQRLVTSDTVDLQTPPSSPGRDPHLVELDRKIDASHVQAAVELNKEIRPASASEYPVKNLHIENVVLYLTLWGRKTGYLDQGFNVIPTAIPAGVLLYGAGSVVRNSVIEVRQGSAIWIYGPNAVLENNTIIVHGHIGEVSKRGPREADAAIRLIQADGAVVRNNRIVMAKGANPRAISLFDTGKIKVEGNTFYGIDRKEQIAQAFIGTVDMEESGSKFEPLDKAPLNAKNDKRSGTWWCKSGSFACPP